MDNQKLIDTLSVALRDAGYTGMQIQKDSHGASIQWKKDTCGAFFRFTDQPKEDLPSRTESGGRLRSILTRTPCSTSVSPS